jgi:hypothetical protein
VQLWTLAAISQTPGLGHVVTVSESRDGKLHLYNDQYVTSVASWAVVEAWQRDQNVNNRLLPATFVYSRKFADISPATGKRKQSSDLATSLSNNERQPLTDDPFLNPASTITDPQIEKLVRDVHEALPKLPRNEVITALQKHTLDLDATMRELISGPADTDMSLNAVELGYRAPILRLHVDFPLNRIVDLYGLLRQQRGDMAKTRRLLESQGQVNLGLTEQVGQATFKTRITLLPSDAETPAFPVQRLGGKWGYELGGRTWLGTFSGLATPRRAPM